MACHNSIPATPVQYLGDLSGNSLWIKREDMIPFCFGGNKARKAQLFFKQIDAGGYDAVVTYGASSSNHCRIVANMATQRKLRCYIISPEEASDETFNSAMMRLFNAEITVCPVEQVSATINTVYSTLCAQGRKPFFIPGGGHGNTGTQAYVDCYEEIVLYERQRKMHFDYIFLASGTGTTQAGLVCGQLINQDNRKIVGISIARKNPRGRDVVLNSVREYLADDADKKQIQEATIFLDEYTSGYGVDDERVEETIKTVLKLYGIPLDATYTGKAFWGMTEYLLKQQVEGKNVLFIHTGGTPLFFDALNKMDI